ncbi:inositol monophosphatase family protein [uncultured Ilyobacter sp.]|uniref:inositol monophosphatase family protein n=1 Tax=uncultured Ilyobacter sp. TaxID=544433 RepID=UPI0029C02E26|nr:inositol monophosphatase family protein [uncultured Ilyobacter sp.]
MIDVKELLKEVEKWAREVGQIQRENFRKDGLEIDTKSTVTDLVTEVDKKSEKYLIDKIEKNFPDHAILGEETGAHHKDSDYLWVLDPLDGTNNYAQGLPIYCISIGLEYRGEAVLGVVYAPYLDEMYTAVKGGGAFCNGKKLKVGPEKELSRCVLATGFPYDKLTNPLNNIDYFGELVPRLRGVRRMGAAAYDLACVAAGVLDGYWEMNLRHWDIAAGVLIVKEAGGEVSYFRDDREYSIIAGNKDVVGLVENHIRIVDSKR